MSAVVDGFLFAFYSQCVSCCGLVRCDCFVLYCCVFSSLCVFVVSFSVCVVFVVSLLLLCLMCLCGFLIVL